MCKEIFLVSSQRTLRGPGDRAYDCGNYDDCLYAAAKQDWRGFSCAECTHYKYKKIEHDVPKISLWEHPLIGGQL
jgi:hypothetical protein